MDDMPTDAMKPGPIWPVWDRLRRHQKVRGLALRLISLEQTLSLRLLGIKMTRPEIGLLGEHLAAKYLRQHGRRILFRNYKGMHRGEVDIVARHETRLTFIEVKTRTSAEFGRPADAVGLEKQRLIQRGAQDWLRLLGNPRISIRFDIAEVLLIDNDVPKLNIIENAFTLPDASMVGR
jgi:putative endonuclease